MTGRLGGFRGQIAGRNTFCRKMTLAYADAAHDPFVVGVNHLFQVGVGENTGRDVGTECADLNALKLVNEFSSNAECNIECNMKCEAN